MQTNNVSTLNAAIYYPLDLRSDSVEEWVAGLPLANLGETCRLIFASLTEINGAEFSSTQRFKALESLRETLQYLINALKQRFIGNALPLPEKSRRVATLLCEMQFEMARGYQITAQQLLTQTGIRQDIDVLVAALHRSLYYFGETLLGTYQTYRHPQAQHWRHIYELYDEAERKALHLSALKDKLKGGATTNVSKMFKHILLLSLADPLRLTQQEMAATYLLLEKTADQCQLYPATDANVSPAAFVVDLNNNAPPARLLFSEISFNESCRLLDATALSHTLRGLFTDAVPDNLLPTQIPDQSANKLPRSLVQRLLISWGLTAKRSFTRMPYRSKATVKFGLSASHETAATGSTESEFPTHAAGEHYCDILNESAAGACLHWAAKESPRVRIGELITLHHTDGAPSNGGIGVVRWMRHSPGKGVSFGIQLLVPSAIPITLRLADKGAADRDYLKGLLLPPLPAHKTTQTLLTPAFLYRQGDIVSVRGIEEREQRLRLIRAVESTQVYTRFQFEVLSAVRENAHEEEKPAVRQRETKFDSIWSGL